MVIDCLPFAMRIDVKLFAVVKEKAGVAEVVLVLPEDATVNHALQLLRDGHPNVVTILSRCAVAVNRAYVPRQTELHDGDELAIIPPVSGG